MEMMKARDTMRLIDGKISELTCLYARMDQTRDLVYMAPFKLRNFNGQEIKNVVNVTMNDPAVFANAIIADLISASRQTAVEGRTLSDVQARTIESFIDDNLAQADENLLRRSGLAGLFPWLCNHICIRSFIGVRWISVLEGGKYTLDCLPVDMRYCPFQYGADGLDWAANLTYRSGPEILAEYPEAPVSQSASKIEVRDFWDAERNEVWVNQALVKSQRHNLGAPPFVVGRPPTGFMLRDMDYLQHESEDLLFLNRSLYDELNRAVSIEQSLAQDCLLPPYEQETDDYDGAAPDAPPKTGEVKKVRKGELHRLLPRGELTNASMTGRQDIQQGITRGGVADIDLGILTGHPTPTALLVSSETEIRGKLILPRLQTLAVFYGQLARMMIDQFRKSGARDGAAELLVGQTGKKKQYSAVQLGDPDTYSISFRLMTKSKKQEVANLAMAQAARGTLPLLTVLKDILLVEDPDGVLRELEVEQARAADPAIALFEMAVRYAEEAGKVAGEDADIRRIQSMMLTERGCAIVRQRRQSPARGPQSQVLGTPEKPDAGGGQ